MASYYIVLANTNRRIDFESIQAVRRWVYLYLTPANTHTGMLEVFRADSHNVFGHVFIDAWGTITVYRGKDNKIAHIKTDGTLRPIKTSNPRDWILRHITKAYL